MRKLDTSAIALATMLCFALAGVAHAGDEEKDKEKQKTVTVDCAKGDSVNKALEDSADLLTVEIRGICHEDVVVDRDDVVLSGRDPALDGLRGVSQSPDFPNAVLRIVGAARIRVENLSIAEGARNGVNVERDSQPVDIVGCEITATGRDGVQITGDAAANLTDTVATGHTRAALAGFGAELSICTRCELDGDVEGVLGVAGARLLVDDSTVTGGVYAVLATGGGGFVSSVNSTLISDVWGPTAFSTGRVYLTGGSYSGSFLTVEKGLIEVNGATHTANAQGFNFLGRDGLLKLYNASSAIGFTAIEEFSTVILRDTSSLDGSLDCRLGGDAACDDPALVNGSSNCEHCMPASTTSALTLRSVAAPVEMTVETPAVPHFAP